MVPPLVLPERESAWAQYVIELERRDAVQAALKARGFFVIGLDSAGQSDLDAIALRTPLALVLGAEGKGLRPLTRQSCDTVARHNLPGAIKSLNVSNAAVLSLYVATRRLAAGA